MRAKKMEDRCRFDVHTHLLTTQSLSHSVTHALMHSRTQILTLSQAHFDPRTQVADGAALGHVSHLRAPLH